MPNAVADDENEVIMSGPVIPISTAPPPKQGITISSRWIGSAIIGDASTSSTVIGLSLKTAFGFFSALLRSSTAIFASASGRTPYWSM